MAITAGEILVKFRADQSQAVREFAKFRRTLNNTIAKTRSQVQDLNGSLNGFALAAGAGLGAAILKIGSDFDKAITNVQAITKETDEAFEATRGNAIELASQYGKAADEVGGALFQIVSAGKRGAEAFQVLTAATKLSKAGLVETGLATEVLIGSLNTFQISGDRAEDVAGKLIGTVDRGILTFEQLASKLGQVSPVANAAGVSFEELLGILALLTRNGVNFAQAVTQTRGAIVKLVAPGKQARVELEKLLGTTIEAALAQDGFITTLEKVVDASDGTVTAFKKLFEDVEALQGVSAIASAGFDTLRQDIEALQGSGAGNLAKTLEIQSRSFAQLSLELKNILKNRIVAFFEDNADAIKNTTQAMINFLNNNELLIDILVKTGATIAIVSAAGLALKAVLFGLDGIFGIAASAMGLFAKITGASSAKLVENSVATTVNEAAVTKRTVSVAAQTPIVTGNALAIQGSTLAINQNTVAANINAGAQRKYVVNTAASAAASSTSAVATTVAATRFSKFTKLLRGSFPTFTRIPVMIAGIGVGLKAMLLAALPVIAWMAAFVATGLIMFKVGTAIGRMISGNTKADEERLKILKKVDKAQREMVTWWIGKQKEQKEANEGVAVSLRARAVQLKEIADLQRRVNEGDGAAIALLTQAQIDLAASTGATVDAVALAKEELKRYEKQIKSTLLAYGDGTEFEQAAERVDSLNDSFGETAIEMAALHQGLGSFSSATAAVERIIVLKDVINGVAEATREWEEEQRQATLVNGLLGASAARAQLAIEQYSSELDTLIKKGRELNEGAFTTAFSTVFSDLERSLVILRELGTEFDLAEQALIDLENQQGIDPAQIELAVSKIEGISVEMHKAAEAADSFNTALSTINDAEFKRIADLRIEALNKQTQLEIEALRHVGKLREADELAAESRRIQSMQRINDAIDEELAKRKDVQTVLDRHSAAIEKQAQLERELNQASGDKANALREQINLIIDGNDKLGAGDVRSLENIIQRSEALTDLYDDQKSAIDDAYGRELEAIERNAATQAREFEDRERRREVARLKQQAADQARIALQAIIAGDIDAEIAARTAIAELELQIIAAKGLQAESELKLIDQAKERIELLNQELEALRAIGASAEDRQRAIQDAQRDTGGASRVEGGREGIQDKLDDVQTKDGAETVKDSFGTALEKERLELQKQLREAQKAGDADQVKEIQSRLQELNVIWAIFMDELRERLKEIALEEQQRNQQTTQAPQNPATATPGANPSQSPQTPANGPQTGPAASPDAPGGNQRSPDQAADDMKKEGVKTRATINQSIKSMVEAQDQVATSISDLGKTVVDGFTAVTGKMSEMAKQININTATLQDSQAEITRINIEGR